MTEIRLTQFEYQLAFLAAGFRMLHAEHRGCRDRDGADMFDPGGIHVTGCLGEIAVARYFNVWWDPMPIGGDDVARIQVRTRRKKGAGLWIKPRDKDDQPFVLVTQVMRDCRIVGWLYAREGKRDEWWQEWKSGFDVPQSKLRPIEELPRGFVGDPAPHPIARRG